MAEHSTQLGPRVPELISLLLPTRQRLDGLSTFYNSAMQTAANPELVEVVVYIDDDDVDTYKDFKPPRLRKVIGPRKHDGKVNLSVKWNQCWKYAKGQIFGHMGDDIVFRSHGWDSQVREAINGYPGKIAFVWGNDANDESQRNEFGTHGFLHKNWTNVIGRFVPPYFTSDYNDTWFNDVAIDLNVRHYIDNMITEHMHFSLGKSKKDKNTEERLARHERDKPQEIYYSREKRIERKDEVERLRVFIDEC